MYSKSYERYWEIDFFRGLAIIMMIIFHVIFDLNYFNIYKMNLHSYELLIFNYSIGTMFLLIVGISLTLSFSRVKKKFTRKQIKIKFLKRGIKIFVLGVFITFITLFFLKEGFVFFGVLHCIGISIILSYPFLNRRIINLLIGLVIILIGIILENLTFNFYWLSWLGFRPNNFYTLDYFPLFPWFGVVLIGIYFGNTFYSTNKKIKNILDLSNYRPIKLLCYLGRYSLYIYFLHHVVILTIIYLLLYF